MGMLTHSFPHEEFTGDLSHRINDRLRLEESFFNQASHHSIAFSLEVD